MGSNSPRTHAREYADRYSRRATLRAVDKVPDPRLDLLTGEALKLMAEGGASAQALGHFARLYPAKAAAHLEPMPPPQEMDLEAVIRATVQAVLGAGVVPGQAGPAAGARGQRGADRVKLNVVVAGKRTTVKLRRALYEQLTTRDGAAKADQLVQSFVDKAPAGQVNRSGWVEEQVTQFLVLAEMGPTAAAQH